MRNLNQFPCSCENSPFKDSHHGHIVTGDLRLIGNSKLRKLFSKGPKYRESPKINWNTVLESIQDGINEVITKWCTKNGVTEIILKPWKQNVIELVKGRIEVLQTTYRPENCRILDSSDVRQRLEELQSRYVICPVDKAAGNIAFICKRFYIQALFKEPGVKTLQIKCTREKVRSQLMMW